MAGTEFDHKAPDYEAVYRRRAECLTRIREPGFDLAALKAYFKDHPVEFVQSWALTFDPRLAEAGLPTTVPFLPFPRQAEFIPWVVDRWRARESAVVEKSRDMGVSWLCVAVAVWMWLFHPGTVVGFGSRKETYVDEIGNPASLFWKVRQMVALLPREFRPGGYDERKHAPHMRVINPDTGSVIVGEAGDNIGRGNRTSIYFVDEAAFLEHPEAIDAALSQTTNCRIDVSTPNGSGNPFYRKRHSGRVPVFTFSWRDDPRKDDAWYKKQQDTLDPVIVAQEIDIDYEASVSDAWVPGDLITRAQRTGPADVRPLGGWVLGVDAGHFGDDESVISPRRGRLSLPQTVLRGADGPQLAGAVEERCRVLEAAGGEIAAIVIELDGPGVSAHDHLRLGKYANKVVGLHTGTRQKDGKNYNLKAKLWRLAKEHLDAPPASLPNCPELKAQLGSVKYGYKEGLLLMQAKKLYKAQFGRSPDRADAWVLSFGADDRPPVTPDLPDPLAAGPHGWMAV